MWSIKIEAGREDPDILAAVLWELGTVGIVEEPGGLRAFFGETTERRKVTGSLTHVALEFRDEPARDFQREMEDSFPPLLVGDRFFLVPPWRRDPAPAGRLRLAINPGMACGTGRHPCTQLCLEAMERYVRPGISVLDVGAGSGILSQAAILLGAGLVVGCDIDPEAVRIAGESFDAAVFIGSVDAVRDRAADLIVANISGPAAQALRPDFKRVLKTGGIAIASGFTESETPEMGDVKDTRRKDGWVCIVL